MDLLELQRQVNSLQEGDKENLSDGYHTFRELYAHRIALFIQLCDHHKVVGDFIDQNREAEATKEECGYRPVWRSKLHFDGSEYKGWFIMGMGKEKGKQISYHLPMSDWKRTDFAETLERAPEWDGHTSDDVLERLKSL